MKATRRLQNLGQSLWLDNITRELLDSSTLNRYINEFSVTGLTSNPTIFERAIGHSDYYDEAIESLILAGRSGEPLLFALALRDLRQAADLFQPVYESTEAADGWVSLEVSPKLADDEVGTITAAIGLHKHAARPNLLIKIPGNMAGIAATEEVIFAGVPVNVTLLFSRQHYLAAANAYMNGIERRIDAGLDAKVGSVASIFVSRWDVAANNQVAPDMRNRLGTAIATRTYKAYCDLLASPRWQKLSAAGAQPQRLLWASTGTKDPDAAETLYVEALAAPDTINTLPEKTLLAFADYGKVTTRLPTDGGDAESLLARFSHLGIDIDRLAGDLQRQGTQAFQNSWEALLACLAVKGEAVVKQHRNVG